MSDSNFSYMEVSAKRKKRNQFISVLIIVAIVLLGVIVWGWIELQKSRNAERIKNALNSQVEPGFKEPEGGLEPFSDSSNAANNPSNVVVQDTPSTAKAPAVEPKVAKSEPAPAAVKKPKPEPKTVETHVKPKHETVKAEDLPKEPDWSAPAPEPTPAKPVAKPKPEPVAAKPAPEPKPAPVVKAPEPKPAPTPVAKPEPVVKPEPVAKVEAPKPAPVAPVTPTPAPVKPAPVAKAAPAEPTKAFPPEDLAPPEKAEPSEESRLAVVTSPKTEPAVGAESSSNLSSNFKTGVSAYHQQDYVNAIRSFSAVPKPASKKRGTPDRDEYVQANFLKGVSLLKVGHMSEAVSAFQNVLEFEKYYPLANMNLGICYVELKQYAKAHQAFEAVIRDQSFIDPSVFDDVMQRTKYFWALAWTRLYKNATNVDKQNFYRQQALLKWKDYEDWFSKNDKYKNENMKAENYLKSLSNL